MFASKSLLSRMTVLHLTLAALLACLSACQLPRNIEFADKVYTNGVIWAGPTQTTDASVLAVKEGRILYVGNTLPSSIKTKSTIDLQGKFVMSGFMDNHVHFMEGGAALASVDLRSAKTPKEFTQSIAKYAKALASGQWVLNGNWDQTQWGGELPKRDWIDSFTKDIPVYVIRIDGHMALANSAALKAAGITSETEDPDGGIIMRDGSGRATGILKGNALNLVLAVIPQPSDDELMNQFRLAQIHALSLGIVKVHAVTAYPTETTMLDIFQLAQKRGLMKIRAQVSTPIENWQSMRDKVEEFGRGDDQLKWGGVKGFIDGSLGARTAWMYEPYTDEPSTNGQPLNNPRTLKDWMRKADDNNLELSIHAIGDRGIDSVINDMKEIAGDKVRDKRYRIEHFQHPSIKAINDIAEMGVIVSMHPYHAIDDGRWAEERIGNDRLATTYAFRSIIDAGGILTFGSDWPVAPLSPIKGIYAAVTRRTLDGAKPDGWIPEQKIDVEEALIAYTQTNAYAFHEEDVAGTLELNKRADFIILSSDPRVIEHEKINDIDVLSTVIGGELVFDKNQ
jgi:predicted amidohydrolase YtcJ